MSSSSPPDQTAAPIIGELSLTDGPIPTDITNAPRKAPAAAVAARLMAEFADGPGDLIFLATNETRADEIASALGALGSAAGPHILVLPPWDCLPYDRAAPSRESLGRRMAVLAALKDGAVNQRKWIVTSPDAAIQRTPPREAVGEFFHLPVGEALDRTTLAAGEGDVLLAINIIENGLDVPRANTMLVWRPERFGLAQLHQLRGRVGRGRRQGYAYLLSDPQAPLSQNTLSRLQTLEALDRLGSGFAISARDLDLRGGGDLVGDEQAGHIRLIGASLYQRVLGRALKIARGQATPDPAPPKLNLTSGGCLPVDYVPDPTTRINLYARLARLTVVEDIGAFHEEIEDRFGLLPEGASLLLNAARLTALAPAAGVTEITSGPRATAFTVSPDVAKALAGALTLTPERRWSKDRLIVDADDTIPHDPAFLEAVLTELAAA